MKPILFNTEMVRALLADRKQMTRRVVKGYALDHLELDTDGSIVGVYNQDEGRVFPVIDYAPYRPGDILYVRETFCQYEKRHIIDGAKYAYKANATAESERTRKDFGYKWHPSIHMPREAARIFLWVADVRVERLQDSFCRHGSTILLLQREGIDIGEQCRDCIKAYGSPCCSDDDSECGVLDEVRGEFSDLWDSTIKPADRDLYGWAANPWVWVITFERISREEAGL